MPWTIAEPIEDIPPPVPVCRFTVAEYHQLMQIGMLSEGDPFELLEGYIVPKTSGNPPHDLCLGLLEDALPRLLPSGWFWRGQMAVTTQESEPDLAIVRGSRRDYRTRHPGPAELGLVIEVADSSLERDQTIKARLYAREGVPVYWIVNLPDSRLEVYSDPTGATDLPHFRQRYNFGSDDSVPVVLDGVSVGTLLVRELLP